MANTVEAVQVALVSDDEAGKKLPPSEAMVPRLPHLTTMAPALSWTPVMLSLRPYPPIFPECLGRTTPSTLRFLNLDSLVTGKLMEVRKKNLSGNLTDID